MMINGFYDLKDDSADAVFIGNSHVYRFWQSAIAWKELGISSASWSTSNMPYGAAKGVTEEIFKTQSPKVLCVEASMFNKDSDNSANKIYLILSSIRNSKTKYSIIRDFCRYQNITFKEAMQYYFPFLQFHSRWYELNEGDFIQTQTSYLNSCYQTDFLTTRAKGKTRRQLKGTKKIAEDCERALIDYLEYCKTLDCEVIFFFSPIFNSDAKVRRYNYISQIIREYGFEVQNYTKDDNYATLNLDEKNDIQDSSHTNIRGSYKFTRAMGKWLIENYGLEDRRGDASYELWNQSADQYYSIISEYVEDIM